MSGDFRSTAEQQKVIEWDGSAFVRACPGAGKTRVLVERARHLLHRRGLKRGIAFLSFTEVAVSELEERLRRERLLLAPSLPHFVGTFDGFLWRFLIAPFGMPESGLKARLIPDLETREIVPFKNARPFPLKWFDRETGVVDPTALVRIKFDKNTQAHETAARRMRARLLSRGDIDHADARSIALARLRDKAAAPALASALGSRFAELIVDEAQDCNPNDLEIIQWFRDIGMPVKVICDPHQSIYGFRGGLTDELVTFAGTFPENERLSMSGNFRSSRAIVHAVACLKTQGDGLPIDEAIGRYRDEPHPVHLLSYPGKSVPSTIGSKFRELVAAIGAKAEDCPVVAATRLSGANALGIPAPDSTEHMTCRLAAAVSAFNASFDRGGRVEALVQLHKVILSIEGHLEDKSYRQHMSDLGDESQSWRCSVLSLGRRLHYDSSMFESTDEWLGHARELLKDKVPAAGGRSVAQLLRNDAALKDYLSMAPTHGHSARTIHSVKGAEFPAVCVVLSPSTTKSMLDHLESGGSPDSAEELRKFYVGASRAQRLLVIAVPKAQTNRLAKLLRNADDPKMLLIVEI